MRDARVRNANGRVLPITTSSSRERAAGYVAAGDFDLGKLEMSAIDNAGAKDVELARRRKMLIQVLRGIAVFGALLYCARAVL